MVKEVDSLYFLSKPKFLILSNYPKCIPELGDNLQIRTQIHFKMSMQLSQQKQEQNLGMEAICLLRFGLMKVSPRQQTHTSVLGEGSCTELGPPSSPRLSHNPGLHGSAWEITDL